MGAIGAVVVPLLFSALESKPLAGGIAGKLFIWTSQLSVFCSLLGLAAYFWRRRKPMGDVSLDAQRQIPKAWELDFYGNCLVLLASLGMLLVVIPSIQTGAQRAFWHALGSAVFGLQWVFSALLLFKEAQRCFGSPRVD